MQVRREQELSASAAPGTSRRMQLRYGFNEIDGWWHMSSGPHAKEIQRRLRLMDTKVVRVFVFHPSVPEPAKDWHSFAATLQGVLDIGAVPMITFAKFAPPFDNPRNIDTFAARCEEIVWGCIEQWGGAVKDWYWCVWNEPNNLIIGGDVSYEQYREIYRRVSARILPLLRPHLNGARAKIGGPSIDGTHRPYWMDWISRLLDDFDDDALGFVSWHRYGDWRPAVSSESLNLELWGSPDSPNYEAFERLLMAQTPVYESRARGVARLLRGRAVENICGELNAISHHENYYTLGLNQNVFGAAYYASALINLLRGGAQLEMRWTATGHNDAYGLVTLDGRPTPACFAKQLFVQCVRTGDFIRFPENRAGPEADAVISGEGDRISGVFVNTARQPLRLSPAQWDSGLEKCSTVLKLDGKTGGRVVRAPFEGTLLIEGYGLAAVTNAPDIVID